MPFDGSGNFSRLYSWQSDRDNGIRILASKMDGEFDNFSAGMNVVFFRNGLVPMSGNLNMGQNYLTGLGAGSLNALSSRFSDDPNTGYFLDGYGRMALVGAGTKGLVVANGSTQVPQRLEAFSGRFFNDANVGGQGPALELAYTTASNTAIMSGFNRTTGTLIPLAVSGSYFSVNTGGAERTRFRDGGALMLGRTDLAPSADSLGLRIAANDTGNGFIQLGNNAAPGTGNNFHFGTNGDGTLRFYSGNYGQGVERARLDNAGGFNASALYSNNSPVWTAANFNPALYAPIANPAFTGGVSLDGANKFFSAPYPTSYLQLNDNVQGVVLNTAGGISLQSVGAQIKSPLTVTGATSLQGLTATTGQYSGTLNAAGAITQNGQQVWHAGNFTPGNYAPIANPVLQGKVVINSQADALGLVVGQGGTGGGAIQLGQFAGGSAPSNFHIVAAGDGALRFYSNSYGAGTEQFRIQNDGATYAGTIYSSGFAVWHAGNFNPNNYLLTTGKAADSTLHNGLNTPYATGNNGAIGTAYVPVVKTDGVMEVGGILDFHTSATVNDYDYRLAVSGDILTTTGPMNVQGALQQSGQQVWHTGNLVPSSYALLSGANFSGYVQSLRFANTGFLGAGQTNARNHFRQFNPGTQTLSSGWIAAAFGDASAPRVVIGQGDTVAHLGAHNGDLSAWADLYINRGGGTVRMGATYRDGGGMMAYQATAGLSAVMTRGTAAPSGGSDGDLYFQYT